MCAHKRRTHIFLFLLFLDTSYGSFCIISRIVVSVLFLEQINEKGESSVCWLLCIIIRTVQKNHIV